MEGARREGRRGVPEDARARDGARARRHRAEEGLGARQGVREGRRGARLRRAAQARPPGVGREAVRAARRERRPRRVPAARRDRRRRSGAPAERDREARDVGRAARPSPRTDVRLLASTSAETTDLRADGRVGQARRRQPRSPRSSRCSSARARASCRRLAALLANHVARVRACQALAAEGVAPRDAAAQAEAASVRRREGVRARGELLGRRARARARAAGRARPRAQGQQPACPASSSSSARSSR